MSAFELTGAGFAYGETTVLRDVTLTLDAGELTAIAGPNGAGKSTLVSILAGLREGYSGSCRYADREVRDWPRRAFAATVSFVPQTIRIEFPFTAEQVVTMGRAPHSHGLFESAADRAAVDRALALTDCEQFRGRDFRSLSGGERQRVILAAALAQEPRALLLDEPTTYLDLSHQLALYRLLRDLTRTGILAVTVTHDLNLAAAFADRVILLSGGAVAADAAPRDAFTPASLRSVFGVDAAVTPGERPHIRYDA